MTVDSTSSASTAPSGPSMAIQRARAFAERPRVAVLGAALLFALLTALYFNPVLRAGSTFSVVAGHATIQYPWAATPSGYHDAVQSDQANNVYPIQRDLNEQLRDGRFPFWSPYSFAGGPTLGTVYGTGLYPLRVALSLTVSASWVHDLLVLFHVWLAGFAMFLLARRLSLSWPAAVLAGVTWMFGPSWFGLALLEGNTILAALLPLSLWLMHRAATRKSLPDAVGCGVVLACFVLGASVQPAVFAFPIVCGWGLLLGLSPRDGAAGRRVAILRDNLRYVVVAGALGIALSAFIVLPAAAQISASHRAAVPASVMAQQDVGLDDYAHWVDPHVPAPLTGDNVWALTFLGWVAGALALVGLLSRRPGSGLGRTLVVVFFLATVGTPLTDVSRALVPGFAFLSPLGRLLPFFALGATLLAAVGLDTLRDAATRVLRRDHAPRLLTGFAVLALAAVAFQTWQLADFDRDVNPPFQPRDASHLFPTTPLITALERSRDTLAAHGGVQRLVPVRRGGAEDPFTPPPFVGETPRMFRLENFGGYLNVIPSRSRILSLAVSGMPEDQARQALVGAYTAFYYASSTRFDLLGRVGVDRIVTGPSPDTDPGARKGLRAIGAEQVYSGADGTVFSLPDARPRAFVAAGVETARDEAQALHRFISKDFDSSRTVLFDGADAKGVAPARAAPVDADVRVLPTDGDERKVVVDTPKAGWLVVLDSYDKGWKAKVSGKDARIRRADFAYRAVQVPAGRSVVEMTYKTPHLRLGVAVTVLGVLAALALLAQPKLAARRRRSTDAAPTVDGNEPTP